MIPVSESNFEYLKKGDTVIRVSNCGTLSLKLKSTERIKELDKNLNNEVMHIYHIKYKDKGKSFNQFKQLYCINIKNFNTDFILIEECALTLSTEIKIFFRKLIKEIICKIKQF